MKKHINCIGYNKLPLWLGPLQIESAVGIPQKEAAAASMTFWQRTDSFQSPAEHRQLETASVLSRPSCSESTK